MAVEDVLPWIAVEPGDDSCLLSRAKIDGVLPPVIKPPRPFRTAVQNLEMHKMQVDRMMEVAVQIPDLDRALVRRGVHVVDGERFTVDRPAVMTIDRLGPADHVPLDRALRRTERCDLRARVRHRGLASLGPRAPRRVRPGPPPGRAARSPRARPAPRARRGRCARCGTPCSARWSPPRSH